MKNGWAVSANNLHGTAHFWMHVSSDPGNAESACGQKESISNFLIGHELSRCKRCSAFMAHLTDKNILFKAGE